MADLTIALAEEIGKADLFTGRKQGVQESKIRRGSLKQEVQDSKIHPGFPKQEARDSKIRPGSRSKRARIPKSIWVP